MRLAILSGVMSARRRAISGVGGIGHIERSLDRECGASREALGTRRGNTRIHRVGKIAGSSRQRQWYLERQ